MTFPFRFLFPRNQFPLFYLNPPWYSDWGLCPPAPPLFCFTLRFPHFQQSTWLFGRWSQHVGPRLGNCACAPSSWSPHTLRQQRYSSDREREMRGPFLISFLFSSFLLFFSSSLRIFLKASAVWSTWGGWGKFERHTFRVVMWEIMCDRLFSDNLARTCVHLTHIISLGAIRVCKVWRLLCYSQLLWHLKDGRKENKTRQLYIHYSTAIRQLGEIWYAEADENPFLIYPLSCSCLLYMLQATWNTEDQSQRVSKLIHYIILLARGWGRRLILPRFGSLTHTLDGEYHFICFCSHKLQRSRCTVENSDDKWHNLQCRRMTMRV